MQVIGRPARAFDFPRPELPEVCVPCESIGADPLGEPLGGLGIFRPVTCLFSGSRPRMEAHFRGDVLQSRPMAQRPLWHVEVTASTLITPHLRQVVLEGDCLRDFPRDAGGDYIKLLLPKGADGSIDDVDLSAPDLSRFYKRSFTVRSVGECSIVLWVTEHSGGGPASSWFRSARAKERCLVTGPGPVDRLDASAATWLLCGDLPGLAGIAANLERLSEKTRALVIVEIPEESARLDLPSPFLGQVEWFVTSSHALHGDALVDRLAQLELETSDLSVWAACEYSLMKRLRVKFRDQWQLPKDRCYLSSYWKLGNTDEEHKQQKKQEFPDG